MSRPNTPVTAETLETLESTLLPASDLRNLAERLQGKHNIPLTLDPPTTPFRVGDRQTFWVSDQDTNKSFQVEATLRFVTGHVYFWIEEGVDYDERDLRNLVNTFEEKIYPTDRKFFGSEWTPGVDGDPHLYMLYARHLGATVAGYFSSADEVSPLAHKYSNAHEMFILSADNVDLGEEYIYGTLAHEFQHMIQWYRDPNETTWLSEGFAELAAFLNGYYASGFDFTYTSNPDLQLTDWPGEDRLTYTHYGASFLFVTYFLDRFGDEATQALVADPANGMDSVDNVLREQDVTDPLTERPLRADDFFADWTIATYLQDGSVADGRYTYHNYPDAPSTHDTETFSTCPFTPAGRSVNQYGVDYIRLTCHGDYTLHFEGSTAVKLLPIDPHSGSYAFWSNRGDVSDMTLTRSFDFANQDGPLTLTYWTWYDLEKDFDYLYLEASTDGENWQILTTPSCTTKDLSGNSYGCGYNASSSGGKKSQWIQEKVDISSLAGKKVQLRFEYVTDLAVNGEGFLLDDIAIPQIGYASDFEQDNGGWDADGFVRIQNVLPQTFRLTLIVKGETTTVEYINLSADVSADVPLHIGGNVDEVILVVSGTSRFSRQVATYQLEAKP
jgi:hypothetical protein